MSRKAENRKYRCSECRAVSIPESEWLTAPNPFDDSDVVIGCPECKSVNSSVLLCDEDGCNEDWSCGFPTGDNTDRYGGYRGTCSEHSEWARERGRK